MLRRLGVAAVAVGLAGAALVAATSSPRNAVSVGKTELKLGQRTGYFHMPRVMKEYRRAHQSVERLKAQRDRVAANLVGLRAMALELQARAQTAQDPKERDQVTRQIITVARQAEDLDRQLTKMLNDQASTVITELYGEMHDTIAEMAREHGLIAVHSYTGDPATDNPQEMELMLKPPAVQTMYLDPSVDYTDELVRRLNEKLGGEAR